MIDFDDACLKALDYLKRNYGIDTVDDPLDVGKEWVFSGLAPNSVVLIAPIVAVSKETGEIRDFLDFMPEDKKLLEEAQPLEFPRKFRWEFRERDALRRACEMALDYMQKKYHLALIGNPTDVGDAWVFAGLDEDKSMLDAPSVAVSKVTGHVRPFPFFEEENVHLLQNGKTLNFPDGFQKSNGTQGKLVTFEDTCKSVSEHFLNVANCGELTCVEDLGDTWVFFGRASVGHRGRPSVEVTKETGDIKEFDFPFGNTRERLKKGRTVEIPEKYQNMEAASEPEPEAKLEAEADQAVETEIEDAPEMLLSIVGDGLNDVEIEQATVEPPHRPSHFAKKTSRLKWLREQFD